MRILKWICDKYFSLDWSNVRGFGQSSIASLTIAMPFVGYIILYQNDFFQYFSGLGGVVTLQEVEVMGLSKEDEKSTEIISLFAKLNFIYLGSLFLGVGSILYRIFAPKTIKEFSSISNFIDVELDRASARKLRVMYVAIKSNNERAAKGLISIAPWLDRSKFRLKQATAEFSGMADNQLANDIFSSFYTVQERKTARFAMYLTVWSYGLGFGLLAVPSSVFTYRVVKVIILGILKGG